MLVACGGRVISSEIREILVFSENRLFHTPYNMMLPKIVCIQQKNLPLKLILRQRKNNTVYHREQKGCAYKQHKPRENAARKWGGLCIHFYDQE
jgi:hypothetical protein